MTAQAPGAREIFLDAVEKHAPDEWPALLDAACGADAALRGRVEVLLKAHGQYNQLLDGEGFVATVEQPLSERPGTQVGPYKLLEQIGEGGFGVVFMAEQSQPIRRKVALKILKPGMDTRQVIARFEAERQALAILEHPNIAKVFDGGTTSSGRPYFVMELVKGVPITEFCDQNHLTPRQRLELFISVCQAVQHAHQNCIIHRDLKPSNVLVTMHDTAPVVKVIDFGVAKALGQELTEKTLFTGFSQMVGTPLYMSPEQAGQSGLDVDTRSDVYSLGVLLYELLTGTTPFTKERFKVAAYEEIRRIIREEEPPRPSTRLSDSKNALPSISAQRQTEPAKLTKLIRGELDWVVMKALEKDRTRRYETANGFARDVQRYLADEPVQACPPSAVYRLQKFVRRNKGPVVAVALVLLTLVGGIVGTTLGLVRAEQARQAEVARAEGERRAKEDAEKRLAQVEKGTEILASVFRDLDPIAAEKAGVTSIDLLCRRLMAAAQQLEGEAVGDSLVVARLQHLLGVSLRELRHPEKAEPVLLKAWRTRERLLGPDHLDTVATKHHLAVLYREKRKYDLAEALFNEVLTVRTVKLGPDDLDTLSTKHHLAGLYAYQQKYEKAEALFREVLDARMAKLGPDDLETVATKHQLAVVHREQRAYDQAELLFQQVLAVRTARLGAHHPDTINTRSHLAVLYRRQQRYAEAESLLKEVVASFTARLGGDNRATLNNTVELAHLYCEQQKYAQAERLYKELLSIETARKGADHADTLYLQYHLARVYRDLSDLDNAIPLLEDTLKRCKATNHPATLNVQLDLSTCYRDAGRPANAVSLLRAEAVVLATELIRAAREQFPAGSLELAAALAPPSQGLMEAGAFAEAEPLYKEVLAIRTAKLGADHSDTILPRDGLALIYRSTKWPDQAIPLLEKSLELRTARLRDDDGEIRARLTTLGANYCDAGQFEKGLALIEEVRHKGSSDPHPAWVRRVLLKAYVQAGKTAEATALAKEQVRTAREQFPTGSLELAAALASTGQALVEVKAYADAEPLYQEVLATRIAKLGADHDDTILPRDRLAHICRSLKKPDQSIQLLQVSLELRKSQLAPDHGEILGRQVILGATYCEAGRFDEGIPLIEEVRRKGRDDPHPAWVRSLLLTAYVQAGKTAAATTLVTERVQDAREQFPDDSPELAAALADNGKLLMDAKANAEAEPLLLEAYQILHQHEGKPGQLQDVAQRLVVLYDAWGKPEEAAKWRKEIK